MAFLKMKKRVSSASRSLLCTSDSHRFSQSHGLWNYMFNRYLKTSLNDINADFQNGYGIYKKFAYLLLAKSVKQRWQTNEDRTGVLVLNTVKIKV